LPYKDQILSLMLLFSFVVSSLLGIEVSCITAAQWKEEEQLLSIRVTLAQPLLAPRSSLYLNQCQNLSCE